MVCFWLDIPHCCHTVLTLVGRGCNSSVNSVGFRLHT